MPSNLSELPSEGSPGQTPGLELYELAALNALGHAALERSCRLLLEMLARDPLNVIETVGLPTAGTDGAFFSTRINLEVGLLPAPRILS